MTDAIAGRTTSPTAGDEPRRAPVRRRDDERIQVVGVVEEHDAECHGSDRGVRTGQTISDQRPSVSASHAAAAVDIPSPEWPTPCTTNRSHA